MARALKNLNIDMNCSTLQPEFGEETVTNLSHEKEDLQLGHGYCPRVTQLICRIWKQPWPWVVDTDPDLSPGGGQ